MTMRGGTQTQTQAQVKPPDGGTAKKVRHTIKQNQHTSTNKQQTKTDRK